MGESTATTAIVADQSPQTVLIALPTLKGLAEKVFDSDFEPVVVTP